MDDSHALVKRFLDGEKTAFDSIYQSYEEYVYHICLGILGNPDDARDAMQETFVSILSGLNRFKFNSKLSTWIYRTAVNQCMDAIRFKKRKPQQCSFEWIGSSEQVERDILREQAVRASLMELKPQYRTILVLRYFQELSYDEIAQIMKWSMDNVRMTLHRARNAFRQIYDAKRCNDEM